MYHNKLILYRTYSAGTIIRQKGAKYSRILQCTHFSQDIRDSGTKSVANVDFRNTSTQRQSRHEKS